MALPRFEIIDETETPDVRPQPRPAANQQQDAAFSALMLALKAMSQKTVIALSKLAALAMVGSVFWLFMSIPNPSTNQIVWGGMYSVFILLLTFLMSRR
jgi:ABC-type siderophore export system fused ATPase/permease subunit